jgi:hypothetical protein
MKKENWSAAAPAYMTAKPTAVIGKSPHEWQIFGAEARRECHSLDGSGDEGGRQADLAVFITDSAFRYSSFHGIFDVDLWFASRYSIF